MCQCLAVQVEHALYVSCMVIHVRMCIATIQYIITTYTRQMNVLHVCTIYGSDMPMTQSCDRNINAHRAQRERLN